MASDHDLSRAIEYTRRGPWLAEFEAVLDEHFGAALEMFDLDPDELLELLGDAAGPIYGVAFEDFLCRAHGPGGRTRAEEYLKLRGWRETPSTRAYLRALSASTASLYEVVEVDPGRSLVARDLIRGGEPVRIDERRGSETLEAGDSLVLRLVVVSGRRLMTGGVLLLSPEASEAVQEALGKAGRKRRRSKPGLDEAQHLEHLAPLFTTMWLTEALQDLLAGPGIVNAEGDEVAFHELSFPLAPKVAQKAVAARLAHLEELERVRDRAWIWLAPAEPGGGPGTDGDLEILEERRILGHVDLKGRKLILMVNSQARAETGAALLQSALGDLVGPPETAVQTLAEASRSTRSRESTEQLPPEVAREATHRVLDRHYRKALDEPIPMLGDRTPRQCAASPSGRQALSDWLQFLESASMKAPPDDPMGSYDFGWLWRELGVEALRPEASRDRRDLAPMSAAGRRPKEG